ncbi:PREDICTED: protein Mdm4 isoform X6 [Myotis brandtii]|uniref:protein Mdm4 isoform X6 n=1 Tax=Myotis brandtii TaxID=109478 RepID=UPI0007042B71|nr:PREDICTED: protein Mdm4 isoform X6 [Myotis brandtii]
MSSGLSAGAPRGWPSGIYQQTNFFTVKMASLSTSAQCSTSDSACRSSPRQIKQVRPKPPLLKILQAAGAQGEIFTVTQVMHFLGQYITMKQLYDPREQHMVYCSGDLLGELLGCQSFSVKDPSPLYAMLRKNLVALTTATAAKCRGKAQFQEKYRRRQYSHTAYLTEQMHTFQRR